MKPVVFIGAGINELVAAHVLARAGRPVLVLEESPVKAHAEGWVPEHIIRALGLRAFEGTAPDPWISFALPDGGRLDLYRDMARSVESIRRVSPADAARWPAFCTRMARLARLLEGLYRAAPVDPLSMRLALRLRRLGRQGMEDLMRLAPMPVAEWLDDWFSCDTLKGGLGALAIRHLQQGPRSGGTAFRLLHHHAGCPPGVFAAARSDAPAALRALPGIDVRTARVQRIRIDAGRAAAVVLADGEEIAASQVVSGTGIRRTFLELVDAAWLDPAFTRAVSHVRSRGVAARISLAHGGSPAFSALVVAPSLDALERAYDAAKYGEISAQPYVHASACGNRLEVHLQFAPYALASGWDAAQRALLAERAVAVLSPHVPGVSTHGATVLAPPDLEATEGWPQGQPDDAELSLDQALWMRPLPQLAHYRAPVEGLWLCGPAMHPGAAILGAAGWNCAQAMLGRSR